MTNRRQLFRGLVAGALSVGSISVLSMAAAPAAAQQTASKAESKESAMQAKQKTPLNVFLYEGFETIDAMGPVEMLGALETYDIRFYALKAGVVKSAQGVPVAVDAIEKADESGILLVPGAAPQWLKLQKAFFENLARLADAAPWVLTVCTGSVLLARTGRLDGRRATTNKNAVPMAIKTVPAVKWAKRARWCVDGKFYTSSGISAGMDMALGFIADRFGEEKANGVAKYAEYVRNADPENDPFAR